MAQHGILFSFDFNSFLHLSIVYNLQIKCSVTTSKLRSHKYSNGESFWGSILRFIIVGIWLLFFLSGTKYLHTKGHVSFKRNVLNQI